MKYLLYFLAFDIVVLDQLSKWAATTHLQEVLGLLPFLELIYHENIGIAFSIPITGLPLIVLTFVLIIGGMILVHRHLPTHKIAYQISIGLILGGAIGNAIDRVRLGYVVDFISVGSFPVFNIADSAITLGGIGLFLLLLLADHQNSTQKKPLQDSPQ